MGDVMGEVNKRIGRVLGMQPGENGTQIVEAEVPMAEMDDFATYIRQVTQGRGDVYKRQVLNRELNVSRVL